MSRGAPLFSRGSAARALRAEDRRWEDRSPGDRGGFVSGRGSIELACTAMLEPGEDAPDFELHDQSGDLLRLSSLRGQTVILYFYPRSDTPGCTTQACGVRDHDADYAAAGARVIGVSPDEPEALRRFAGKYGLGFTLLADPDHSIAEAYGAWGEKSMYGKTYMGIIRSTFIIDADGTIARVFPKVAPKTHDAVVLEALRELGSS